MTQHLQCAVFEALEGRQLLSGVTVPNGPYGLVATPVSTSEIDLSWVQNNNGAPVDGYRVLDAQGNLQATLPSTATSYKATGLTPATPYSYEVLAFNSIGISSIAGPTTVSTLAPNPMPASVPYGPYGLTATVVSPTEFDLNWINNNSGPAADGYAVFVNGLGPVAHGPESGLGPDATSYKLTNAPAGTTFSIGVEAYNAIGASSRAGPVIVTTPGSTPTPASVPYGPYGLTATVVSPGEIDLAWINNNAGPAAAGYAIFVNGLGPVAHGSESGLGPNATSYKLTNLGSSGTFNFTVQAYNVIGVSAFSNAVTVNTFPGGQPPPATTVPNGPFGLAVEPGRGSINLSFIDNADNESGLVIERALVSDGVFNAIATLPASPGALGKTYYVDTTATDSATAYEYRVFAVNAIGTSSIAGPASANPGLFNVTAEQLDGKSLVAGQPANFPIPRPVTITRYLANGAVDTTYADNGTLTIAPGAAALNSISAIAIDPATGNAAVLIGGVSPSNTAYGEERLPLISPTGQLLKMIVLDSGPAAVTHDQFIQPALLEFASTGKIAVAGYNIDRARELQNAPAPIVVDLFLPDLTPDPQFGSAGRAQVDTGVPTPGFVSLSALTTLRNGGVSVDYVSSGVYHQLTLSPIGLQA